MGTKMDGIIVAVIFGVILIASLAYLVYLYFHACMPERRVRRARKAARRSPARPPPDQPIHQTPPPASKPQLPKFLAEDNPLPVWKPYRPLPAGAWRPPPPGEGPGEGGIGDNGAGSGPEGPTRKRSYDSSGAGSGVGHGGSLGRPYPPAPARYDNHPPLAGVENLDYDTIAAAFPCCYPPLPPLPSPPRARFPSEHSRYPPLSGPDYTRTSYTPASTPPRRPPQQGVISDLPSPTPSQRSRRSQTSVVSPRPVHHARVSSDRSVHFNPVDRVQMISPRVSPETPTLPPLPDPLPFTPPHISANSSPIITPVRPTTTPGPQSTQNGNPARRPELDRLHTTHLAQGSGDPAQPTPPPGYRTREASRMTPTTPTAGADTPRAPMPGPSGTSWD